MRALKRKHCARIVFTGEKRYLMLLKIKFFPSKSAFKSPLRLHYINGYYGLLGHKSPLFLCAGVSLEKWIHFRNCCHNACQAPIILYILRGI